MALTVGPLVKLAGVPSGMEALAAVEARPDAETGEPVWRRDRQGRLRYDRVWVQTCAAASDPVAAAVAEGFDDGDIRWLTASSRSAKVLARRLSQQQIDAAVRVGLIRLLHSDDFGRLGPLVRSVPHPDAAASVQAWHQDVADATKVRARRVEDAWEQQRADARAWARQRATSGSADEVDLLERLGRTLPADNVPMSALALQVTGDSHALWSSGRHATVAVAAAAAIAGREPPTTAAQRREVWADVGVLTDPWSSTTTGLRLPYHPDHPAGRVVAAHGDLVAVITLEVASRPGQLVSPPPASGGTMWVVENPATLASLEEVATDAPVLCRKGTPSVSDRALIRAAAEAGWTVAVTSDFEPGGLAGARVLLADAGAHGRPWRLAAGDYDPSLSADRFVSAVGPTPWDPALRAKMERHRARVLEEHRLELLAADAARNG